MNIYNFDQFNIRQSLSVYLKYLIWIWNEVPSKIFAAQKEGRFKSVQRNIYA